MNNSMKMIQKVMSEVAYKVTERNVNSACCLIMYQEQLPKNCEKLKKKRMYKE